MTKRMMVTTVVLLIGQGAYAAVPPSQPKTSEPGGSVYHHRVVTKSACGQGDTKSWIFEPDDPKPAQAPLIVFNHGWGGTNPATYGAWIEHLVRRGNIVVYPVYQDEEEWRYPTNKITPNAIAAVKNALECMRADVKRYVQPDMEKFAILGHSAGGLITANMAALAASAGLPVPKAIMCVQPGKTWAKSERVAIPLDDLSSITSDTLLLVVVGDHDQVVQDVDAKKIFKGARQIPLHQKDFVVMVSDAHGVPALEADHFAPVAVNEAYNVEQKKKTGGLRNRQESYARPKIRQRLAQRKTEADHRLDYLHNAVNRGKCSVNALDYYGLWKLFDGLYGAAFFGKDQEYALGNTPKQRSMGVWSDGVAVQELHVTDEP